MAATPIVPVIPVDGWRVATPGGPSASRSEGMPSRGIPGRYPAVNWFVDAASCAPSSSVSFSSSVISLSSRSTRPSPATRGACACACRPAAAGLNAEVLDASAAAEPIQPRPITVTREIVIRAAIRRAVLPDVVPMAHLIVSPMACQAGIPDRQPASMTCCNLDVTPGKAARIHHGREKICKRPRG